VSTKRTFQSLEIGRGLAALAVVLFHTNATMALPKYFGSQVNSLFSAGDSGVAFFFVLSGVVMVLAHGGDPGHKGAVGAFIWKRFRRIYLPLWPVLAFMLVAQFAMSGRPPYRAHEALSAFMITPAPQEPLLAVEWTLRHEILFYALFAAWLWRPKIGAAALALWFAASVIIGPFAAGFPLDFIASPFHLLFFMGMGAAYTLRRAALPRPGLVATIGVAVFAASWICACYTDIAHKQFLLVWAYGAGATLLIRGTMELERSGRLATAPASMRFLGAASYSIYLVHFPVVSAFCKLGLKLGATAAIWYPVTVAAAVLVGAAYYLLIERPLARLKSPFRAPFIVAHASAGNVE
jgi:peptidoglycan/LPS O-acetylase OafA/YrhL